MFSRFFNKKSSKEKSKTNQDLQKIKLVIVSFEDNCLTNSGKILSQYLSSNTLLSVAYYDENLNKSFLDLQSRNFFDLTDTGNQILKKTNSDILIWGYREDKKIRLNFQTKNQYENKYLPFFSLLNSLYLPLEDFQQKKLTDSILNLIFAAILAIYNKADYLPVLQQTVAKINNSAPPKNLNVDYMPYILNMLALCYLASTNYKLEKSDIKIVSSILKNALAYQKKETKSVFEGLIYANLGQLYHLASDLSVENKYTNCQLAIDCYNLSQKYFYRHTYPYDFAFTAYRLSKLYFDNWKYTTDIQSLRDAVFQLREALKVFSNIVYPKIWAEIQNDLGLYLSMMAVFSKNEEIGMIAVDNYKKYQTVYTMQSHPIQWAKAQENIANIFFECGKIYRSEQYFEQAYKYYSDAENIYTEYNLTDQINQIRLSMLKTDEYLMKISQY